MPNDKAPVPEEEFLIPFGEANIRREGRDITLIGTSSMVQVCEKAPRHVAFLLGTFAVSIMMLAYSRIETHHAR